MLKAEPYVRLNDLFGEAMLGHDSCEEKVRIIESINFKKFVAFKQNFFKHLNFKWFIGGHLNEEKAKKMFEDTISNIEHTCLNEDQTHFNRNLINLPENTIHEINQMNPENSDDEVKEKVINPNSAI